MLFLSTQRTADELRISDGSSDVCSSDLRWGTRAQMNPPLRDARHRDGLWRGIAQGIADCIGSDHAPHTIEEKARPYPKSPSGMTGVQTLVPLMLDHGNAGRSRMERFVDLTTAGPARTYKVPDKGRNALRHEADPPEDELKTNRTNTKD